MINSRSVSAKQLTTMAVGGTLSRLYEPNNVSELKKIIAECPDFLVLGNGSNLLVPDCVTRRPVVKLGKGFRSYENISGGVFRVGASMPLMTLSRELSKAGFSGLEFAGGIPASVGGATKMNAGAHGNEMVDVLRAISFIDAAGKMHQVSTRELDFSYRKCELPADAVIFQVEIELCSGDPSVILARQQDRLAYRKATQPLHLPSAGSVFKNPSKGLSAGALIESLELKGYVSGGAVVSSQHANWIVNPEKEASYNDVVAVLQHVQKHVLAKRGLSLAPELVIWSV